ncbi:error-prone DNA polymerase [Vibrio panuliri]|uniref:Error-prone DNA polymerase n=1 Tax=Vibrio panuliri TaxID=1381081 RepID=A0ABX3FB98_9VIBR|nr:error-prone DNA polymerase [Vibrio panuliri]KAB1453972.1 DNA polymerase III subunit alpha [Vibrio panuliri]OLQ87251.1 error-prone DNA polymerase [Vibrio panuliri]
MAYAELFCQSNFSFLTGASHAEELILQADFLRYRSLAITDECSVAGVVRAHTAIKSHQLGVKLIIGSMFWLNKECQVVLLCPNRQAYAELCRIITNARRRSDKGEYQLSEWDLMSIRHCLLLWLPTQQTYDQKWGRWLAQHHDGRLWLGIQRHLGSDDHTYLAHCQQLAAELQLPITACGGVLMHTATRLPLQHTLTAIKHGGSVNALSGHLLVNTERSLRSIDKLSKLFKPQWLQESVHIAQRCTFSLSELRYEYPSELIPNGETPMSHLRKLVDYGTQLRFPQGVPVDIEETIEKELSLIEELNYPFYFLTIHDIVMFAKRSGILYQGRGSAANSVVCYCLEITSVDPRQISVLFERFISKERDEPPDIDVDFEHQRREEVIQYIYQKYGRERAALAATVISYRFKSAVRDVGKALGIEESQLDYFIKNINRRDRAQGWQAQIVQLGIEPNSLKGEQFIQLVNAIIGFPRHLSQHVGGFVISSGPLYELVPIENASMAERTVIQWDKDDLESLALLKVDVLALGMLSAIRKCFQLVERFHGERLSIAEITRRQDDANVYSMIQRADTVGVFQIESRAQMSMLPRLKPASYYDLVIQIAIVRPGPIQGDMVHPFLKRRNGEEDISYPSDEVKQVLERTMGVPIFQEQVIKLAMVAAGFSGGEADQLRRAMAAWKKNGDLVKFRTKLVEGMLSRGYEEEFAQRIFDQILGFGEYGFPESHSASFAVLAYCSAWLKFYYPEAFYTSLLNSLPMGFYSASQLIQDAKRHGLTILPVCVNHSDFDHQVISTPNGVAIRLGFRQVKGLSQDSAERLIRARPIQGFHHPTQLKQIGLNRRDIELLASANALQTVANNRYQTRWAMMDSLSDLPLFHNLTEADIATPVNAPSEVQTLLEDYASMGLSLTQHPITLLANAGVLGRFTRMTQLKDKPHQSLVTVVGVVTGRQSPGTAAGVTFFTLEDDTGNINVVVWQATARAQQKAYLTAKILRVKGILEREGEVTHVIAGRLEDLTDSLHGLQSKSRDFH